jgi:Tfp pilus assembly protein FimT
MIKKILNFKFVIRNWEQGMTYVELIVVLSIFATMSAVVLFNYSAFQSKIDIKNLSNDIALKIVEAQKSSISGRIPPFSITSSWRPSYGVYINPSTDNKSFSFFADVDQDGVFDDTICPGIIECLEKVSITKGNTIAISGSGYPLSYFKRGETTANSLNDLTITFIRPSGVAVLKSTTAGFSSEYDNNNVDYIQISVLSPKGATATIRVYPSGRIEIH